MLQFRTVVTLGLIVSLVAAEWGRSWGARVSAAGRGGTGASPQSPNRYAGGQARGSAGLLQPLKGTVQLNFSSSGKDKLALTFSVPAAAPSLAGLAVSFDMGGIQGSVTLDGKGKSPKGGPAVTLKADGERTLVTLKVTGSFSTPFKLAGIPTLNAATPKPFSPGEMTASLTLGDTVYSNPGVPGGWIAKPSKSGKFTFAMAKGKGVLVAATTDVAPGDTLRLSGSSFDPNKPCRVLFANDSGYSVLLDARVLDKTAVEVPVPPYLDVPSGVFASGTVRVSVLQDGGSAPAILGSVDGVLIEALPTTGLPPGALMIVLLRELQRLADATSANLATVMALSDGKVAADDLRAKLASLKTQYATLEAQFQAVSSGTVASVTVGSLDGMSVVVDPAALELMDRICLAYIIQAKAGTASASARDFVDDIAADFEQFLQKDLPKDIREFATRFQTAGNVILATAALIGVAAGVPVVAPVAIGALLWNACTFIPAAQMAALEGGTRSIIRGNVSFSDFEQTTGFLIDQSVSKLTDALTDGLVGRLVPDGTLGEVAKNTAAIIEGITELAGPVLAATEVNIDAIGIARFDGLYVGTFSGSATVADERLPVSGPVRFTVSGGVITGTEPGPGNGKVAGDGSSDFASAGGGGNLDGVNVSFSGTFTSLLSSARASGGWTASFEGGTAAGSWKAIRE